MRKSQSSSLAEAQDLFDVLSSRSMVAGKAMMTAYIHHGCLKNAIKLLIKMQDGGASVEMVSYIQLLEMCANQGAKALTQGKEVHSSVKRSGYERNIIIGNSLISMYGKCHSLEDAERVFDQMPEKDVVTWNALIAAHAQKKHEKEVLKLFLQMQQAGMLPNEVTCISILDSYTPPAHLFDAQWFQILVQQSGFCSDVALATALVNAHAKNGRLVSARIIFDIILEPNIISWTTMITSCCQHGCDLEALQLFKQMLQQGALPDLVTFATTINATTSLGSLKEGKAMHICSKFSLCEMELLVTNALVNMYGKCGHIGAALDIFDRVATRSLETWNIMIGIYAQHGGVTGAYHLLHRLEQVGLLPDKVTSVSYLSACSRAGLVEEALRYMNTMHLDNIDNSCFATLTLEHYDCIVDVLGRANQLHVVGSLLDALPLQPSGLSWMTVFTVCRDVLDVKGGEFIARHLIELDPMLVGFT